MQIVRANEFPADSDALIRMCVRPISVVATDGVRRRDPHKAGATEPRYGSQESTSVIRRRPHAE